MAERKKTKTAAASAAAGQRARANPRKPDNLFVKYLSDEEIETGLKRTGNDSERIWSGPIRVNPKNYKESFVTDPDGGVNIMFPSLEARNRALDGDVVAYKLYPEATFQTVERKLESMKLHEDGSQIASDTTGFLQKRAHVVGIRERRHTRRAAGCFKQFDKASATATLAPMDHRVPRVVVPLNQCPEDLSTSFSRYQNMLFVVTITDWPATSDMASGSVLSSLGARGILSNETSAILETLCINDEDFPAAALACLPEEQFSITDEEISRRRDLRSELVFTIDPDTARDMDDAIHCKALEDGKTEVGVHIADVTYFVESGSALDQEASQRCTSTYLVNRMIPMLPHRLSSDLCSLKAHEDRLAVSVVWVLAPDGAILDAWMGRSVIHSRAKLSYRVAQEVLDEPEKAWTAEYLNTDESNMKGMVTALCQLLAITSQLRQRRAEKGFLAIRDNDRLAFALDDKSEPIGCQASCKYATQKLIEELMLLANITVAGQLSRRSPDAALLRRHDVPEKLKLAEVEAFGKKVGMPIDCTSVQTVQTSLASISSDHGELGRLVICQKLLQAFKAAEYYTLADEKLCSGWSLPHYALHQPLYTHFTSPIRRYADVIVHRQLLTCLETKRQELSEEEKLEMIDVVSRCNGMRMKARKAGEESNTLYFGAFIRHLGLVVEDAVVVGVLDRCVDVMLLSYRGTYRIHCNSLPLYKFDYNPEEDSLTLVWKPLDEISESAEKDAVSQQIKLFTSVKVVVRTQDHQGNPLSVFVYLKSPPGCSEEYGYVAGASVTPSKPKAARHRK